MAAFTADELKLEVDGGVEQVFGQAASGSYFELLGLQPAAGRLMTPDDDRLDPPVAVIGHGYWQRRFGGAPDAIGHTFSYRDRVYTIVGVTPPQFWELHPGREVDVTLPITHERGLLADGGAWWFDAVARLRPGATQEQASAQAGAILEKQSPIIFLRPGGAIDRRPSDDPRTRHARHAGVGGDLPQNGGNRIALGQLGRRAHRALSLVDSNGPPVAPGLQPRGLAAASAEWPLEQRIL